MLLSLYPKKYYTWAVNTDQTTMPPSALRNIMSTIHPYVLLFLSLFPLTGFTQVYTWKDASGKVHYGDRPPVEQKSDSRKLTSPPPETAGADAARKAEVERQLSEREKQQKTTNDAKNIQLSPAETKQRADNCQQAKSSLAAIESGQVRFSSDEKGGRIALEGAAREAELGRARKAVESWCAPPKIVVQPAAK
jgi:hypothetical protein